MDKNIIVYKSSIRVENYEMGDCGKLERILSVWDKVTFRFTFFGYIYDEINKTLILPRGFDVSYLNYLLPDYKVKYDNSYDANSFCVFNCNSEPKTDEQKKAIEFLLKASDDYPQKMLVCKTGFGKTFCTIYTLSKIQKKAMIIVDMERIQEQWKEEFTNLTNISENDIYFISGRQSIEKLMKSSKPAPYKIYISTHRTLSNYLKQEDDLTALDKFFNKLRIGVKIFDEAHVEYMNILTIDMLTNTYNTFYLTATPERSDFKENKLYENVFKTVPKYGQHLRFTNNYHNVTMISFNSEPDLTFIHKCKTRYGFDGNKYSKYLFSTAIDWTYDLIKRLLDKIIDKSGKTAIVLHRNEDIQILYDLLTSDYLPNKYSDKSETDIKEIIGIFSMLTPKAERSLQLEKQLILTTDKSFGKALNVNGVRFLISFVTFGSIAPTEQLLGRLRKIEGKEVMMFDVFDRGFPSAANQATLRKRFYKKKCKSLNIIEE